MRFNSTYLRIILLTLILLVGGQDKLVGAMAQQRSFWGMIVSGAAGTGVKITALRDKSPAGNCLNLDDVLLAIEPTPIKSVQQFELVFGGNYLSIAAR